MNGELAQPIIIVTHGNMDLGGLSSEEAILTAANGYEE